MRASGRKRQRLSSTEKERRSGNPPARPLVGSASPTACGFRTMSVPAVGAAISRPQTRHHPGSCHCEAAEGDCGNPFSHHPQDNYISTTRRVTEAGTFASAAGGGKSEQKGVAAVEILRAISEQEISGTATGHNGAALQTGICSKKKAQDNYISTIRRGTEAVITGRS